MTVPCTDPGLEVAALALVMLDPSVLDSRFVEPRELTDPRASVVMAAMYALRSRGEPIETASVLAELQRTGSTIAPDYLLDVTAVVPINRATVAPRLRQLAAARRMRAEAVRLVADLERVDITSALSRARDIAEQRDPNASDADHATMRAIVEGGGMQIRDAIAKRGTRPTMIRTGIQKVDETIVGLEYGDLTVIGGDTSVGKSSTALLMAIEMAKAGHHPGIVSVEDPRPRWERRVIAAVTGVPILAQKTGQLSSRQFQDLDSGAARVVGLDVHFMFCVGAHIDEVISAERTLMREHGCDVVILDYMQAVEVTGAYSRRDEMRIILSRWKGEANRAKDPASCIVLSQYRKRDNECEQPTRAALYEANDIAQKADTILLLWKDGHGVLNGVLDKAKDDKTGLTFIIERDRDTGMLVTHQDGSAYKPKPARAYHEEF